MSVRRPALASIATIVLATCAGCGGSATSANRLSASTTSSLQPTSLQATSPTSPQAPFTLDDGFEHDVCGIGLIVVFIPSSSAATGKDEAVLIGGPVSNVQDTVSSLNGDQVLPANTARLEIDTTVTVKGKSFHVAGVDTVNTQVQLQPLC